MQSSIASSYPSSFSSSASISSHLTSDNPIITGSSILGAQFRGAALSMDTDSSIDKSKVTSDNEIAKDIGKLKKRLHSYHSKMSIVPPPPLAKYRKPAPVIPHRPGERYPLGIPYSSDGRIDNVLVKDAQEKTVRKIAKRQPRDTASRNTFKKDLEGVVYLKISG
jgi:hypothetical protein